MPPRTLFHFEMPEAGGGYGGGDPAPEAPDAPAEEAPWAPAQDQWESVVGYIQAQQQREAEWQAQQQAQQQPQTDPRYEALENPWDDRFGATLAQEFQAIRQELASYRDFQQSAQMNEAEERAIDILEDDISRNGEFLDNTRGMETARALANIYYVEEAERHGAGPKAAEAALQRAASTVREYEQAAGKAYHERQLNQLSRIGDAPREPQGASAGVQQGSRTAPGGDELSVVTQFGGFPGRPH